MSSFYNSENGTCIYLTRSIFDFGNRHFVPEKLNIVNLDTFTPTDTVHYETYVVKVTTQIAKKELTGGSVEAANRKYDGTDKVKITGVTLLGIVENDDVSVDVTEIYGNINGSDVGTYTEVTALPTLSLTGDTAGNYELIQPEGEVTIIDGVKIDKALWSDVIINKSYYYGKDYPDSIDLAGYLPKNCGEERLKVQDYWELEVSKVENLCLALCVCLFLCRAVVSAGHCRSLCVFNHTGGGYQHSGFYPLCLCLFSDGPAAL